MKLLGRVLWLVPFAAQIAYILATSDDFPRLVGGSGGAGTRFSAFIAEWFALVGAANLAFVFVHARLPSFSDRTLSVPGKVYWLSSAENRAVLVEKLRGICETALLMLNVFFLAVYQSIYQTNAEKPVIFVADRVLVPFFMVLPVAIVFLVVILTLRFFARAARGDR